MFVLQCRAALLVIIAKCLQKKTDALRDALRTGMSLIKEMSAGGESARSEVSLIEVFEYAIARLDATEDAAGSSTESEYSRFKKWEMLWKNHTPVLEPEAGQDGAVPMPPAGFWRGPSSIQGHRHSNIQLPVNIPLFGMEGIQEAFPSLPQQTLDEFSSFFGYGYGASPESMAAVGGNGMWMGQTPRRPNS
jgi:hypothetical protein